MNLESVKTLSIIGCILLIVYFPEEFSVKYHYLIKSIIVKTILLLLIVYFSLTNDIILSVVMMNLYLCLTYMTNYPEKEHQGILHNLN